MNKIASDPLLNTIVDYVYSEQPFSNHAYKIAKYCLWDSISCALSSLNEADCLRLIGPYVEGTIVPNGVPVFGTNYRLDPIKAAFDMCAMTRWMDFNDTSFAGGHPSDSIGAILSVAYFRSQQLRTAGLPELSMQDVLHGIIQAYEIQGMISFANKFDQPSVALDHVIGVKIAASAVVTKLLGGSKEMALVTLGNVFMDGGTLNAYRHVPNAGPRKSWAGADAASRAVWHAFNAVKGEPGYQTPLSDAKWGFEKVFYGGKKITLSESLGSFVLENIIFKFYPCQRNVSTALEAAIQLHHWLNNRFEQVKKITIFSHDEAIRRTDKKGALTSRAARDHCMQYIVAIGLLKGQLALDDYLDETANNPLIDSLRDKMVLIENPNFSKNHHDIEIRSCANAIQIELVDGSLSELIQVDFPMGDPIHRDRVESAIVDKFNVLTSHVWDEAHRNKFMELIFNDRSFFKTSVSEWMNLLQS
jgi:2-methylcitrate dehydratase